MSRETEAARKRRMKAVVQLATAAQTLRHHHQDHLARQLGEVADALHADPHYGRPVR